MNFGETSPEQEARWADEIKYYAARWVWTRRFWKVPRRGITWERWWELKFGESYLPYVERMAQKKKAAKVGPS